MIQSARAVSDRPSWEKQEELTHLPLLKAQPSSPGPCKAQPGKGHRPRPRACHGIRPCRAPDPPPFRTTLHAHGRYLPQTRQPGDTASGHQAATARRRKLLRARVEIRLTLRPVSPQGPSGKHLRKYCFSAASPRATTGNKGCDSPHWRCLNETRAELRVSIRDRRNGI